LPVTKSYTAGDGEVHTMRFGLVQKADRASRVFMAKRSAFHRATTRAYLG